MVKVEFTVTEVTALCEVARRLVQKWVEDGKFPGAHLRYDSSRMGYLIPAEELLEFVTRTNPMIVPRVKRAAELKERDLLAVS